MSIRTNPLRLSSLLTWRPLWLAGAMVAAASLKLFILPLARMPFDSDEAILLLMARHIVRGEHPLFFYGEAYGGSFDSYLIALFYRFLGDTVVVGRLVQSLEYLVGIGFTYLLARRLMPKARFGPLATVWVMAIPPLLVSTWTTPAVLYAIVICLGSIITYLGYRLLWEDADRPWRWALFGAVAGLGFWTFGILVVNMLPLFILFLWHLRRRRWPAYGLGVVAFFLFSAPWWTQALAGLQVATAQDPAANALSFPIRVLAFLGLTLPTFFGVRAPSSPHLTWPALAPAVMLFYLAAILYAIPRLRRTDRTAPVVESVGFALLGIQVLVWLALYFGTHFSVDATGRYILPLYPALSIVAGLWLERINRWKRPVSIALLAGLLVFNLGTHIRAVNRVPPGITAQMNPALQFDNSSDQALIDFVAAHGGRGYSHHWISYKIDFLSRERVILAALLPYRPDLRWNPRDDRYPPYTAAVAAAPLPVYVTHREPHLEAYLQAAFAKRHITYWTQDIGPYRVYYSLSTRVSPEQLGLGGALPAP
jgi:4-amino-4-deoxy-L-arabinose transferase-like glycosyltransferase